MADRLVNRRVARSGSRIVMLNCVCCRTGTADEMIDAATVRGAGTAAVAGAGAVRAVEAAHAVLLAGSAKRASRARRHPATSLARLLAALVGPVALEGCR